MFNYVKLTLGLLLLSVFLMACGNEDGPQEAANQESMSEDAANDTEGEPGLNVEISEDQTYAEDEVVLVINGEEVLGDVYNTVYVDTLRFLLQNNQETEDDAMLKQQTLQTLKTNTLIEQDAAKRGIYVTNDEVNEALSETKSQFETDEAYQEALAQLAYTEESFFQSLKLQLLKQKYVDEAVEVEAVTEAEIDEYYALLQQQSEDLPALEQVKEQISMQLEQSNIQQAFQTRVESLMAGAEIEERI
ncbi:hypothetical protein GCM10012290_17180 [Halolactibacillus alkaliphilus]|uniref:Peptidylprolyl isomerase n=1 Tax=Halolactibacillus alkaliphilus TaxID=442899 RepID=A0A511X297_9BACI|nr:SurA N-terminal domain-containing protein [Halolactibacillus alkaliphilus]GEN57074.1 hypothetical protein HAL01_15380 [Halolactibacillus alkaliphilus]GGN71812.1 hypothetical protein GCM10012290_17180 [Halolactibacillus alkaliphilus]SFO87179.1 SurA N-terminal domain-containing protein [Halolactibacillus alkaliphilus]